MEIRPPFGGCRCSILQSVWRVKWCQSVPWRTLSIPLPVFMLISIFMSWNLLKSFVFSFLYCSTLSPVCIFYLPLIKSVCVSRAQLCPTLCNLMACPWNPLGKNTGVGCHSLLWGDLPNQGIELGLLHCRQILYHLSYQGGPREGKWIFLIRFFPIIDYYKILNIVCCASYTVGPCYLLLYMK